MSLSLSLSVSTQYCRHAEEFLSFAGIPPPPHCSPRSMLRNATGAAFAQQLLRPPRRTHTIGHDGALLVLGCSPSASLTRCAGVASPDPSSICAPVAGKKRGDVRIREQPCAFLRGRNQAFSPSRHDSAQSRGSQRFLNESR